MMLLNVRFLLGLGEAVVYPASSRLMASWIHSQERGIANGLMGSAMSARDYSGAVIDGGVRDVAY
jgi:MFS family permease